MARKLSKEAKNKLMDDTSLFADVCDLIEVKPNSLSQLVYRNSPWLTNYDVVMRISEALGKAPDQFLVNIIEEPTTA